MNPVAESILTGVGFALVVIFWIWFFRYLYLNGWRPLVFILIAMGWERLRFYIAWIRYSRRRDKMDAFLAEAERRRRQPVSGLIEKPDP